MIRSLSGNNNSFANMGSVAIQPAPPTSVSHQAQQQTTVTTHPSSFVLSVNDSALSIPVILHSTEAVQMIPNPTLSSAFNLLVNDSQRFISPFTPILTNQIVPTYALTLGTGRVYDPRLTQGFVNTTTKFQPYEQLTGISQERPELVMLTNFQPLFNRDVSHTAPHFINHLEDAGLYSLMTDAGHYIDAQFNMRSLRWFNVQQHVRMLYTRYPQIRQDVVNRAEQSRQALLKLKDDASFLLNLVRIIESQKSQLDLRHDLHQVDPNELALHIVQNFSKQRISLSPDNVPHIITLLTQVWSKPKYDIADTLIDLGYTPDSVRNVFASTKLWMQLLAETKSILEHHSLSLLDITPNYQQNDQNPSTILQPPVKLFDIVTTLPSLPTLDELIQLQVGNASKTVDLLQPAFTSIYQNVFFKNEESRIAGLAHLLSREYRYSYGLSQDSVRQKLESFYGYKVSGVGNLTMFESIIGRFGNNITDFPAVNENSLISIAQNHSQNVGVLTFESKYVEGDTGTLTPGGDFYFDRILETNGKKFDTSAIDDLAKQLGDHGDNFSILCDGLNLLSLPVYTGRRSATQARDTEAHFLSNAQEIIHELADQLINTRNGVANQVVINDRLGAVFSQARNDTRIKTLLFLYVLSKISRSYTKNVLFFQSSPVADNTPLVDYLIEQLVMTLESTIPETRTTVQLVSQGLDRGINTSSMTKDTIRHALKSGTRMTAMIENFMSSVISQFRTQTTAITGHYTRYSGYLDTIIMMMAFDFAISTVARYSNQRLVGMHHGLSTFSSGQTTFVVSQTSINHLASFNDVIQRINHEENLTRQVVMTIINTLRKLSGSLKGISNYLGSKEAVDKLHEIGNALKNDPTMMRMLFSEQQILLLASTVESLVTAMLPGQHQSHSQNSTNSSYHSQNDSSEEELAILDESEVAPQMYEALLGLFHTSEYASQRGLNKRILTVGIPMGFTQRLKQKVNIREQKRATFENKRNDIVQITIYKVDMQNADIVYKPVKYLFEMSRFPTRAHDAHWLPLRHQPTLNDIINAIPTQNFTQNPDAGTASSISSGVEYASTSIADSEGVKGARAAFNSQDYSFLAPSQKGQILENHVLSQLLEAYIKLMTGINVSEYTYHMQDPPPAIESEHLRLMAEHTMAHIADNVASQNISHIIHESTPPVGGVLFSSTALRLAPSQQGDALGDRGSVKPVYSNPAGIAGSVSPSSMYRSVQEASPTSRTLAQQIGTISSIDQSLSQLSHRHVPLVTSHLQSLATFAHTLTTFSTIDAINHHVLSPKQFDRVFNVIVDARDFEIDVEKTLQTPYGRQALDLLIRHGDVVPVGTFERATNGGFVTARTGVAVTEVALEQRSFPQGRLPDNVNGFKFRDRDKNQGDLIADKYFVTIETFGEDEV